MKLHGWKTVSGFLFTAAIAAVGGGGAGLGCSATASGGSSTSSSGGSSSSGEMVLPDPTGCNQDSSVICTGGGDGFSCASGDNPEAEDPTYSCSTPVTDPTTGGDDYCCISFTVGGSSTCTADDGLTTVCPDPDSYGYVCDSGDDPTTLDASLNCSMGVADADGVHDDFCCTLTGGTSSSSSSSGGAPPSGCTADSTLGCTTGADGYACAIGDNPETEDPTLSCSTPALASGEDDYCCYSGFTGDSTTCAPDDGLTQACPDPTSYGYICASGDDPTSYDSSLNCSGSVADPDGVHDDFCCTFQ
jgi:hypothetical protein